VTDLATRPGDGKAEPEGEFVDPEDTTPEPEDELVEPEDESADTEGESVDPEDDALETEAESVDLETEAESVDAEFTEADAAASVTEEIPDAAASVDEAVTAPLSDVETTAIAEGTPYEWAPAEPQAKKRRWPLWAGIGAGAAVVGLVAASLVLIAPGTSVAGVPVGFLTPGAAADALQQRLAETTIVLTGGGGNVELTGAELGATVDARGLAEAAFAEHPMWNPTQWFPPADQADVLLDPIAATAVLRGAAPDLYLDPVDATLAFDTTTASYVTTPAEAGEGIDVQAVLTTLREAYDSGETHVEFDPVLAPVEPTTTTAVAEDTAATLNGILATAGFYIGDERTVPVDRALAASWLTVTHGTDGTFDIAADQAAIQAIVDTLPAAVNRDAVNAVVITNTGGTVLREVTAGVAGRAVGDTSAVAGEYAAQLASAGSGIFQMPVEVQEFTTTALARRLEVNLSSQRTYLWENGTVVGSHAISSGLPGSLTPTGNFTVFAHTSMTDMGCYEGAPYCTEDVPWVTWFAQDIGFHGAYWHNNFGNRMSHGCVNMPVATAKFVYDWAPVGTEVSVHY